MTPRPLDTAAIADKNTLASDSPYLWLYEIEIPTDPPTRYRLVRNTESVDWNGFTFSPANVSHGPMVEDAQGTQVTNVLTVQNVTREILAVVESYGGLGGQTVDIHCVLRSQLASGKPVITERFAILTVEATEQHVSARLGQYNAYRTNVPGEQIQREHCRFKFRGERCGYIGTDHDTCDNTLTGPDGCEQKASDSTEHPKRFGGFPHTPRQSGIGVKA